MRRRIRHAPPPADSATVDLTPLIDVVFVVLVLFILIAPMLTLDKIQLAQAPARQQPERALPSSENAIDITVTASQTITLNGQPVTPATLKSSLLALRLKNPRTTPKLYQDLQAPFGLYQLVKNAVEEAGYSELDVLLRPAS